MRSALLSAAVGLIALTGCGEKREPTGTGEGGGGRPSTVTVPGPNRAGQERDARP